MIHWQSFIDHDHSHILCKLCKTFMALYRLLEPCITSCISFFWSSPIPPTFMNESLCLSSTTLILWAKMMVLCGSSSSKSLLIHSSSRIFDIDLNFWSWSHLYSQGLFMHQCHTQGIYLSEHSWWMQNQWLCTLLLILYFSLWHSAVIFLCVSHHCWQRSWLVVYTT